MPMSILKSNVSMNIARGKQSESLLGFGIVVRCVWVVLHDSGNWNSHALGWLHNKVA